jgi:cell division protein FtsZ
MVRPGMINLDFADVETVMSAMGKAMMGTGEAEGENRAMAATDMALNNPLIDEYSLQGAKGLLINITGGNDLTLFEVDQSVNKIRAEVDPEAELIFGAIKDENMTGKIRVSIVATALDGHRTENKTVLNMFSRVHNRNNGYSENLFSQSGRAESHPMSSIDGATALKLDENYHLNEEEQSKSINDFENHIDNESFQETSNETENISTNLPTGVSIESASYMENNNLIEKEENLILSEDKEEEHTPKLFSEDQNYQSEEVFTETEYKENNTDQLFDQDINEEEDFEIPAFLRKQKF